MRAPTSNDRHPRPLAARLAPALIVLAAACGGDPAEPVSTTDPGPDPTPVVDGPPWLAGQDCVLIILDATHAAHLSCYGGDQPVTPIIDGLAAQGVQFGHAWSSSSWTLPSTVSLFTGLYEQSHGVRGPEQSLDPSAGTMAESFQAGGYATVSLIQNPYAGRRFGLERGFDDLHILRVEDDEGMVDQAAAFLNDRSDEKPHFAYLHFRRPHAPYDPSPESRARFVPPGYEGPVTGAASDIEDHNRRDRKLDDVDIAHLQALYRANLHDIDRSLGRLFEAIDLERTVVIVTSDHGEAFGQHFRLGHNWRSFEEFVHVPLVVHHPSLARGHVVPQAVQTLDLLPTFLQLFQLPAPPQPLPGRSQVRALTGGRAAERQGVYTSSRPLRKDGSHWLAVSDGRWKYMTKVDTDDELEFLFDLVEDPLELYDLSKGRKERTQRLRDALSRWVEATDAAALTAGVSDEADEETLQRLRELGYLEGR